MEMPKRSSIAASRDLATAMQNAQEGRMLEVSQAPTGLYALNRKERRRQEKQRRSAAHRKAQDKHMANVKRQMQAQIDARAEMERRADLPFADPANIEGIARVFDQIEAAINSLVATGEINVKEDGTPVMWVDGAGAWCPASDALISMAETWELMSRTFGWNDHSEGLRKLGEKLEHGQPIYEDDVAAARKCIEWMKICVLTITPRQFHAEAQEIQIKHELKAKGLAGNAVQ